MQQALFSLLPVLPLSIAFVLPRNSIEGYFGFFLLSCICGMALMQWNSNKKKALNDVEHFCQDLAVEAQETESRSQRDMHELSRLIGHEIGNPLANISFLIELLEGEKEESERQKYLQMIKDSLAVIEHAIAEIRLLGDKSRILNKSVDLKILVQESLILLNEKSIRASVRFETRFEESLPQALADPEWLKRIVLFQILQNALRFTPPEKMIMVSLFSEGAFVVLKVQDEGIGIPQEMLASLHEIRSSHLRPDQNGERGFGIGLVLVHRLMQAFGGFVKIASTTEEHHAGTSVALYFQKVSTASSGVVGFAGEPG